MPKALISINKLHGTSFQNTTTNENETLIAIGTAYVQGEDVAARGRVLLFSAGNNTQNLVFSGSFKHLS